MFQLHDQYAARRPTWAEISLAALTHNYRTLKQQLTEETQLMAVVKAGAYGHGAIACARALEDIGADWFGVALVEEGIELRQAGITRPICCLGGFWQGQADEVIAHELTPAIFSLDAAEELEARAKACGRTINIHLKVDTGMGRLGVPAAEVGEFALALQRCAHLRLDGVLTHFAEADSLDHSFTTLQTVRYDEVLRVLQALGYAPVWRHLAASAGLHAHPQTHGTLVRAGATLYGLTRDVLAPQPEPFAVQPVLSLHSRIELLKTAPVNTPLGYGRTFVTARASRIATIPIGYADGLRRAHSNKGRVLVRGQLAPIVGRVSMDLTIIDVTDVAAAQLGDVVILIGEQGDQRLTAEDLAAQIGTISYEIVTGISARVPRVYLP
jgi:alanine racemase